MSLTVSDEDGFVWEADPEQTAILQEILDRIGRYTNNDYLDLQYQLDSAEAEIERLRGYEIAARDLSADLTKVAGDRDDQAARIKDLEDAHKRSGAKYAKIINELRSSVYANIPGLKKQWDEILNAPANGKIGPDADAKPHCWQITEERKDALRDAAETLADRSLGDWETIDVLNVMLTEADHDKP